MVIVVGNVYREPSSKIRLSCMTPVFYFQEWTISRKTGFFGMTHKVQRKLWIQTFLTTLKNWPCVAFFLWEGVGKYIHQLCADSGCSLKDLPEETGRVVR